MRSVALPHRTDFQKSLHFVSAFVGDRDLTQFAMI